MEQPFKDPGIPDGETSRYRVRVGGRDAGTATIAITATDSAGDGPSSYVQRIDLEFAGVARANVEFTFHREHGHIHIAHYRGET